jgi:hypothetical protein
MRKLYSEFTILSIAFDKPDFDRHKGDNSY